MTDRPIVLTGGGTGGHAFPLRAIAEALVDAGVDARSIVLVAARRGDDASYLEGTGARVLLLHGRGIVRSMRPRAIVQNIASSIGLLAALARAVVLVGRLRPRAVVSVGGYAAFAASAGAVVWRRPLVLVDLDATPGLVNRLFSRRAAAIATAFAGGDPRAVVTGAPLRDEIVAVPPDGSGRRAARARLGVAPEMTMVAVMTGSLGSGSVNEAVCGLAARWRHRGDVTLYHVTGRRDYAQIEAARAASGIDAAHWRTVAFERAMADVWAACDVAVCRAGATTVAELCATGVPSVLVPLSGAPGAHQSVNAAVLERAGAAVVIDDPALDASSLDAAVSAIVDDPARRRAMSAAARSLSRPDAAARVARLVLDHAR